MKALVYHGNRDIRLEEVNDPSLQGSEDAIVRLTLSPISLYELHLFRGDSGSLPPGTILGRQGVGVVEAVGDEVTAVSPGDRVVVSAVLRCGRCPACQNGRPAACTSLDSATGGPAVLGSEPQHQGLHAQRARIPHADANLLKLPESLSDEHAVFLSDILPRAHCAVESAEIQAEDWVAIVGCGPTGQFAIASAKARGAGRIFAIDQYAKRLEYAATLGAEAIDECEHDAEEMIRHFSGGRGVDRLIDTRSIEAMHSALSQQGPSPLERATDMLARTGTLVLAGEYPRQISSLHLEPVLKKNLRIHVTQHLRPSQSAMLAALEKGEWDVAAYVQEMGAQENALEAVAALDNPRNQWPSLDQSRGEQPTLQQNLDEGLEETFPASDPPAISAPQEKQ